MWNRRREAYLKAKLNGRPENGRAQDILWPPSEDQTPLAVTGNSTARDFPAVQKDSAQMTEAEQEEERKRIRTFMAL